MALRLPNDSCTEPDSSLVLGESSLTIRFQFETVLSIDKCDCEQPEDGFSAYEYWRIPFHWYTHLDLNWVAVSPPALPMVKVTFDVNRSMSLPSATLIGLSAGFISSSRYSAILFGITTPSDPESRSPSVGGLLFFYDDRIMGMIGWYTSTGFPVLASTIGFFVLGSRATLFL